MEWKWKSHSSHWIFGREVQLVISVMLLVWRHRRRAAPAQSPLGSSWFSPRSIPLGSLQLLATFVTLKKEKKKELFNNFLSDIPISCQEGLKWDTIPSPCASRSPQAPRILTWHGFKMKDEGFPSSLIFKSQVWGVFFEGWGAQGLEGLSQHLSLVGTAQSIHPGPSLSFLLPSNRDLSLRDGFH